MTPWLAEYYMYLGKPRPSTILSKSNLRSHALIYNGYTVALGFILYWFPVAFYSLDNIIS